MILEWGSVLFIAGGFAVVEACWDCASLGAGAGGVIQPSVLHIIPDTHHLQFLLGKIQGIDSITLIKPGRLL
jgi:hypothetical protein